MKLKYNNFIFTTAYTLVVEMNKLNNISSTSNDTYEFQDDRFQCVLG